MPRSRPKKITPGVMLFYQVAVKTPLVLQPLPACSDGGTTVLKWSCPSCSFPDSGLMGEPGTVVMDKITAWCDAVTGQGIDGWRSPWDQDEVMVCKQSLHKLFLFGMHIPNGDCRLTAEKNPAKTGQIDLATLPATATIAANGGAPATATAIPEPMKKEWPVHTCGTPTWFDTKFASAAATVANPQTATPPNQPANTCTSKKFSFLATATPVGHTAKFNEVWVRANCKPY